MLINVISQLILNFEKNHPDILINIELCGLRELQEELICGNFDCIACLETELGDYRDIDTKTIQKFKSCFAISKDHPAATCDRLDTSKLHDVDFYRVVPVEKEDSETRLLELCASWGFVPRGFTYVPNKEMLKLAIKHNKGIAICGAEFGKEYWPDIRVYSIEEAISNEFIVLAWHKYRVSDAAKKLLVSLDEFWPDKENVNQNGRDN